MISFSFFPSLNHRSSPRVIRLIRDSFSFSRPQV
jgi:hypothetical protein